MSNQKSNDNLINVFNNASSKMRKINDQIAKNWSDNNFIHLISHIGDGGYGNAYEISGDKVLKITSQFSEAAFAYDAMNKRPKGYVRIYSVENIYDEYDDFLYSIILMDKLVINENIISILININDNLERHHLSFNTTPDEMESILYESELYIFEKIHNIVNDNKKDFEMPDLNPYNIGLKDNNIVVFDQYHLNFDEDNYKKKINKYKYYNELKIAV